MAKLLVLHGPNLNLLGVREPHHYGETTLAEIDKRLTVLAQTTGHSVICAQSNAEHELIERIHHARDEGIEFVIINPGGLTHTSVALRDALVAVEIPFIEIHLSNVYNREPFRHQSYLSDVAVGVITGLGPQGYELALQAALNRLKTK